MQPDTIINLVAGGALAAFLARLLQQQYETRIADLKERVNEQSSLLNDMTKGFDALDKRVASVDDRVKGNAEDIAALKHRPARGG